MSKTYILKKDCPNIGKEAGDYYNNEYSNSIEELLEKGTIEEELLEEELDNPTGQSLIAMLDDLLDREEANLDIAMKIYGYLMEAGKELEAKSFNISFTRYYNDEIDAEDFKETSIYKIVKEILSK